MSYVRFIGFRYLMAKKRSRVVSIITLISIAGVALGVTALIVVLSVMGGFKKDLKDKILGTKAHIVVEAAKSDYIKKPEKVVETARKYGEVSGAAPFVEKEVMVSSPTNLGGVILRGIDPSVVGEVSDLPKNMVDGELAYLNDPTPLMEQIDKDRKKDREEFEKRHDLDLDLPPDKPGESDEAAEEKPGGDGAGGMPSMFDEETDSDAAEDDDGGMRPMFEDDQESGDGGGMPSMVDGSEDDNGSGMAPMFDDDSSEDEGASEQARAYLPGLVVGAELAKSLQVELGDEVNVVSPEGEMGPTGPMPRSRPFKVVGVFKSGMYEYDANHAYTTFDDARSFLSANGATGVELKTDDPSVALEISPLIQEDLGDEFAVRDWQEMNRSLFFALELEKIAMFVVLTFIILVASFSIIAMLIMIVIEKAREIAVLKSMGVSNWGVMKIFMFQGWVIGSIGAVLGLVLGLGICVYLQVYGVPLNSEVYYITKLPVEIDVVEVTMVLVCALVISLLATVYPSLLAARLKPVEGLRYE
ncbi:MAG: FtsX-like permease family protein [Myxococcota bacterium]